MKFILPTFLIWRIFLTLFLILAVIFVPLQKDFLGGELEQYVQAPYFWAWGNFDGQHYVSIAYHGYSNGEQAFFPLYPLLMNILAIPLGKDISVLQMVGLVISHASFFIGLLGLWKLIHLDYPNHIVQSTILLLLVFPTSFYFGSVYTEALFFALVVWTFYAARTGRWWLAGILGGLATGTRVVGIVLLPSLLIEWWIQKDKSSSLDKKVLFSFLIPIGIFLYMCYLKQTTGDWLAFIHTLPTFGEQRSSTPIFLPQTFWRYIKILGSLESISQYLFVFILELSIAIIFLIASIVGFKKLRISYAVFLFLGYLLSTISGSFSSLPRYVLPLFPAFLLGAIFLKTRPPWQQSIIFLLLFILLSMSTVFFVRGYWIA